MRDRLRLGAHADLEHGLDEEREREGGHEERLDRRAAERPERDPLHGHRRERGREERRRHDEDPAHVVVEHRPHDVAADREQLAVGEVDQAHDREEHREPEREQRVRRAEREPVDALLDELVEGHVGTPR